MYETTTTIVGTLITAPNRRRLPDGTDVLSFRVASNERRYDRATDEWNDGDTLYVTVTCWRKLAANVHASFVTGDPVIVLGRLFTREYEKDGRRHSVTELEATAVGPDLARSTASVTRNKRSESGPGLKGAPPSDDRVGEVDDPWASTILGSDPSDDEFVADVSPDNDRAMEAGVGR